MRVQVLLQVAPAHKFLWALRTAKWLVTQVNSQMTSQVTLLCEDFVAMGAGVLLVFVGEAVAV